MTAPLIVPSEVALAELLRRRRNAQALVSQNRLSKAAAEQAVARWCGIAAWFGAVLPAELRPYDTVQTFLDHAPRGMSVQDWRTEIARQLRRDTEAALAKAESAGTPEHQSRARALLALDNHLSLAAGLPAIGAEQTEERKAA